MRGFSKLNFIAALGILLFLANFGVMVFGPMAPMPARRPTGISLRQWATIAVTVWWLLGILTLIVDAFRRRHTGARGTQFGLAIGGLFSLGISSLLYYVAYGWSAIRPADEVYGDGEFCFRCLAETTDQPAPSTLSNLVAGSRLVGDADLCPDCNSRVKTLWLFLYIPIAPMGSYRVIHLSPGHYVGRRTRLNARQVLTMYALALALAGPPIAWIIYAAMSEKQ